MDLAAQTAAAAERLKSYVRHTPVERSSALERESGAKVWLKLENYQRTGSFKIRGAMNKLLLLDADQRRRGVVAASSGNHGVAVAAGAAELRISAVVYVPEGASPAKVAAIRAMGCEVRTHGADCVDAEAEARRQCRSMGLVYLSPYNDADVVAGQGSVGVELAAQVEHLDALYVAVGGGGLISGVAAAARVRWPRLQVIGCSPERSPLMRECVEAGRVVEHPVLDTLSDGTAGGVEHGSITLPWCQSLVNEWTDVGEDEIADAMRLVIDHHHMLVEGAAGVAVAAFRRRAQHHRGQNVGIVLCGANLGRATLQAIL